MKLHILPILGALLAASTASAVTVTNPIAPPAPYVGSGELVLGFGSADSTYNVEVALGTAAYYQGLAGGQLHAVGRLSVEDLRTAYGETWQSSTVNWGIFGWAGSAINNTTWASMERSAELVLSGAALTPYNRSSSSIGNTVGGKVKGVQMGLAYLTPTTNSPYTAVVETSWAVTGAVVGSSWTVQGGQGEVGKMFSSALDKATVNNSTEMTVTEAFTQGVAVSDVFAMPSGSGLGTYLGTFAIDGDGNLWYANDPTLFTAVPEPSTYAMICAGLTLGVVAYRRRFVKQA